MIIIASNSKCLLKSARFLAFLKDVIDTNNNLEDTIEKNGSQGIAME